MKLRVRKTSAGLCAAGRAGAGDQQSSGGALPAASGGAAPASPAAAGRATDRRAGARSGGREVADRRDVLPVARAGRRVVRRGRGPGQEGPGALHHRSDEADERDHLGVRGRAHRAPTSRTASRSSTASGCSRSRPADRRFTNPHVQENPDRQPRRDRAAGDLRLPRARHQDRRGLLGGRRELAARPLRRRGRLHRPGAQRRQLSQRAGGAERGRDHRRRRDSSRLRLPVRERLPRRGLRGLPHQVHRPGAERHPSARRQGAGAPRDEEGRHSDPARQRRPGRRRGEGAQDRPGARLSGDHQGGRRRRRPRHARHPRRRRR